MQRTPQGSRHSTRCWHPECPTKQPLRNPESHEASPTAIYSRARRASRDAELFAGAPARNHGDVDRGSFHRLVLSRAYVSQGQRNGSLLTYVYHSRRYPHGLYRFPSAYTAFFLTYSHLHASLWMLFPETRQRVSTTRYTSIRSAYLTQKGSVVDDASMQDVLSQRLLKHYRRQRHCEILGKKHH